MKVWPIDPLVPRNLRLEVPEKFLVRGDFSFSVSLSPATQHLLCAGSSALVKGRIPAALAEFTDHTEMNLGLTRVYNMTDWAL